MSAWRIAVSGAFLAIALALACRDNGWRRGVVVFGTELVRIAILVAPIEVVSRAAVPAAGWCVVPLAIAAGYFGRTTLGVLNFMLLQWFGVRLAEVRQRVMLGDGPGAFRHERWTLQRWVWPLTGWWSDYRWIARRR